MEITDVKKPKRDTYDVAVGCARYFFCGVAISVAGIFLWLTIITWEIETSCQVISVLHNDTFAFEKTNCIWVDRCTYDTCRNFNKIGQEESGFPSDQDNIPCCESTSHGKSRGFNRCLMRRFNRTITRVTFYSSSQDLQTFEVVITDFPDIPPQVNQSWPCHYEHNLRMDDPVLRPGTASNTTWISVVCSISGFIIILCLFCFTPWRKCKYFYEVE